MKKITALLFIMFSAAAHAQDVARANAFCDQYTQAAELTYRLVSNGSKPNDVLTMLNPRFGMIELPIKQMMVESAVDSVRKKLTIQQHVLYERGFCHGVMFGMPGTQKTPSPEYQQIPQYGKQPPHIPSIPLSSY